MRQGQGSNKRSRGRNGQRRPQNNNINRTYESNGPDVKIRGTAQTIHEKYVALARDASSSGDDIMAERYLQHAEHYFRIVAAIQAEREQRQQRRQNTRNDSNRAEEETEADASGESTESAEAEVIKTNRPETGDAGDNPENVVQIKVIDASDGEAVEAASTDAEEAVEVDADAGSDDKPTPRRRRAPRKPRNSAPSGEDSEAAAS